MLSLFLPCVSSAGVHGGAGARGAVPAIRPERGSAGDSESPRVRNKRQDADQHKL